MNFSVKFSIIKKRQITKIFLYTTHKLWVITYDNKDSAKILWAKFI